MTDTKTEQLVHLQKDKPGFDFKNEVLIGLTNKPMRIPSKYFYDKEGSRIFEEIMALEEYYPTNCEWEIFETYKSDILNSISNEHFNLIDIGAGDGAKTKILISHFLGSGASFTYVPIDISGDILQKLAHDFSIQFPKLNVKPVKGEYNEALAWLKRTSHHKNVVLFLGGNIGNFPKAKSASFLREIKHALNKDDFLLIGIDLKKDPRIIINAYDDKKGVTAAFNLNLLQRINNELGGNFNLNNWQHFPFYNPQTGAVESYLISKKEQHVFISALEKTFHFHANDAIHTEFSFKYSLHEISELAKDSGFKIERNFYDKRKYFSDSLWKAL